MKKWEKVIKIRSCCYNKRCYEKDINYKDMLNLVKQYSSIILDVRSKQEYLEGHIDGAINIPLSDINQNVIKILPNKQQLIIAYCTSGIRSRKAQKILKALGYINVYNLKGGFQ